MKIEQEVEFKPITITLESKQEAEAFFRLMHKIEGYRCNEDDVLTVWPDEVKILIALCNAETTIKVNF